MIEKKTLEKRSANHIDSRPVTAFFLTMLAMVTVFTINMIVPFGNRNVLTSDLAAQYGPYLIGYKRMLTSGDSLLYSQSLGMGSNTLGVFGYYLSSPLNLIMLLIPGYLLQVAVTFLICTKLSFAGAFMTWLLDRKFKSNDKITILFGMMYPLCSFAIIYMFNIMWLDGFAILPLLILLTERFIENKRVWPVLTLVLFILFVSGYYMAYMVGIFSFIYFLSIMGYQGKIKKETEKEGLKTVGLFILSAVTAALMSACILLPAGLNTLGNPDYMVNESMMKMDPEFKLASLVDQLVEKKVGNLSKNLPYIFCGLTALFLCILFFLNPKIKRKLKIAIGIAFGGGILCFHFPFLNMAWHLFDDPNWFNFRYSYIFSFVMILVAFYSYLNMKSAEKKHFFAAMGIVWALAVLSQSFGQMAQEDSTFFATLLISGLICVLLYGKTLDKWPDVIYNLRKFRTVFLVAVIVIEIVVLNPRCYMPDLYNGKQEAPEFTHMLMNVSEVSDSIQDTDWYRAEMHNDWHSSLLPNNLPFYTGKNGISIFASMANKKTDHFLKQLGYDSNYNFFSLQHDYVIQPADSILGVRYIFTADEDIGELKYVTDKEGIYLFKNEYALPAAFLAEPKATEFDGYQLEKDEDKKDYFDFQEKWISSLSGLDASDIYDTWNATWEVFNGQETDVHPEENIIKADTMENRLSLEKKNVKAESLVFFLKNSSKVPMVLRTTFTADRDGAVYFVIPFLNLQCLNDVYVNDEMINRTGSSSFYSQILNLGYFKKGDKVKVEIRTKEEYFGSFKPIFAYVKPEAVQPHRDSLTKGMKNIVVENGHYVIETESDKEKLLLITAPYEKGWKAYVDGVETEITAYQDAFLSIPLSAGTHKVELRFTPPGWNIGLIASAAGLLLFAVMTVLVLKKKKEKAEAVVEVATEASNDIKPNTEEEKK